MTIALVAALAIGESFTAAVIVLFVLRGRGAGAHDGRARSARDQGSGSTCCPGPSPCGGEGGVADKAAAALCPGRGRRDQARRTRAR